MLRQLLCASSTGTFFIGLGVDLVINQQRGMSRGLRFLFDQNTSHIAVSLRLSGDIRCFLTVVLVQDILANSYVPPLSTKIILGASLALMQVSTTTAFFLETDLS
jgi:hypothetical protein